MVDFVEGHSLH